MKKHFQSFSSNGKAFINNSHSDNKFRLSCEKTRCDSILPSSHETFLGHELSVTEKEIYSHQVIAKLMEQSHNKTIKHEINKISTDTQLFVLPQQKNDGQFNFHSIPPTSDEYASQTSRKFRQIYQRLSDKRTIGEKVRDSFLKEKENRRCLLKTMPEQNVDKKVSVSGLVSYNFNSVQARRSLTCLKNETEEKCLQKKVKKEKLKSQHILHRQNKIMRIHHNQEKDRKIQLQSAIVSDFYTSTDKFLRVLHKEATDKKSIYNEQLQKLNCIKQYMGSEQKDYEESKMIVERIEKHIDKKVYPKRRYKTSFIDDEVQLSRRKKIFSNKKVLCRHLTFVD